jgi:hypothetical protein
MLKCNNRKSVPTVNPEKHFCWYTSIATSPTSSSSKSRSYLSMCQKARHLLRWMSYAMTIMWMECDREIGSKLWDFIGARDEK